MRRYTTFCASLLLFCGLWDIGARVGAFPDGAPVEICIRNNHPNHPKTTPQPPSSFPFVFIASRDVYHIGGPPIKVLISGPPFKGFFVQARRGGPHGPAIGEFKQVPHTKGHPECSGITHNSSELKKSVELTWLPTRPEHPGLHPPSGKVVFLATVLSKYDIYWENIIAKTHIPPNHF